jgi:hypothetical protein
MKLKFDYCECGCKSYTAQSKGLEYSIFWDLTKDKKAFSLWRGITWLGAHLGDYSSYKNAKRAAQNHWNKIP